MNAKLPEQFTERLKIILPPILTAQNFTLEPLPNLPNCYKIPDEQRQLLTHSALYQAGKIYIQNISSMLPVIILAPQPSEKILDLTAAPGSKTILMACLLQNKGNIAAVEAVKPRFFQLKANLAQYGVENVNLYLKDGRMVWKHCFEQFDKVLLDAPCSSEARFKTYDAKTFAYWSTKKIQAMSRKQKQLIYSAIQCLKPGGTLIYSTCSFAPEENELIIQHALKKFKNSITIESINLPFKNIQVGFTRWQDKKLDNNLQKTIRILPTNDKSGFYICKLKKLSTT